MFVTQTTVTNTQVQGGVLGISSDRGDRMEPKVKTQKNPYGSSSKTPKNPWTKC